VAARRWVFKTENGFRSDPLQTVVSYLTRILHCRAEALNAPAGGNPPGSPQSALLKGCDRAGGQPGRRKAASAPADPFV